MKITDGVKLAQRLETPKKFSKSKQKVSTDFKTILENFDAKVYGNTNFTPYAWIYNGSRDVKPEFNTTTLGLSSCCAISMLEKISKTRNLSKGTYPDLSQDVTKREFCVLA